MESAETGNERVSPLPPPLKWAGGKRWLVPRLQSMLAHLGDRRLVEPFVGGLSVALGLRPRHALLSDRNDHLIYFYTWLQRGLVTSIPFRNERSYFLDLRTRFNHLTAEGAASSREASEIFYYLNRTGFNGLCRFNSKGEFNVPFGRYAKINYREHFLDYTNLLSSWHFVCADFESLALDTSDIVYADPPYDVEFTKYSKEDFSWGDQERLAHWLSLHPGPVVASNQFTPRVADLYRSLGFVIEVVDAPRRISCDGNRNSQQEILATRNL